MSQALVEKITYPQKNPIKYLQHTYISFSL